jgi:hypothetical protein
VSLNNNSVTLVVCESDLDVGAVTGWAGEVLTIQVDVGSLRVLGYTECWFNLGNSWTVIESKVSANVLPVLVVLHNLNSSFTSVL